jgi:hypothetical protein
MDEKHLWQEILEEERHQTALLEKILTALGLLLAAEQHAVAGFVIMQLNLEGEEMPILGIAPGATGQFSAQPVDKNQNNDALPAGVVPVWTSSDTVNTTVTPTADGLGAAVAVSASAPPGTPFTLSISATLPDGTTPTGTASVPVFALEVASFVINQTA